VLATDAPSTLPPSAITSEFQRAGSNVRTLSYLLPLELQAQLKLDEKPDNRRSIRTAIEETVFKRAKHASFLWLGIGGITTAGSFRDHCEAIEAKQALLDAGAVAEVGFMPVDKHGCLIYDVLGLAKNAPGSEDNWRRLSMPLRRFFNSTYVLKFPLLPTTIDIVVVAGGKEKRAAIQHGLQFLSRSRDDTGLGEIAYFVTDEGTIDALYRRLPRQARSGSDQPAPPAHSIAPATMLRLEKLATARNCSVEAVMQAAIAAIADPS
jgi:hypothetical protein